MKPRIQRAVIIPAYLDRFTCIGDQCEDDCCHDWLIHIDRVHYVKIKKAMSVDAEQQALFKTNVQLTSLEKSSKDSYAHFVLDQHQRCCFLNNNGLCDIQAQYSQNILPDGCKSYPRKQLFNGISTEVYGSLSCPEIARLCLLVEDAMEPVEGTQHLSIRDSDDISLDNQSFYQKYIFEIRVIMVELLESLAYSIDQRIFQMLVFSQMTVKYFHKTPSSASPIL